MTDSDDDDFGRLLEALYPERKANDEELQFFQINPEISGMATDDRKVVLSPFAPIAKDAFRNVARNERVRLLLDDRKLDPGIMISPSQLKMAQSWGGTYATDRRALRQTIIARILSDDDSLAPYTPQQRSWAKKLKQHVITAGR